MGEGEERDRAGVVFLVGLWLSKPSWIVLNDWTVHGDSAPAGSAGLDGWPWSLFRSGLSWESA